MFFIRDCSVCRQLYISHHGYTSCSPPSEYWFLEIGVTILFAITAAIALWLSCACVYALFEQIETIQTDTEQLKTRDLSSSQ